MERANVLFGSRRAFCPPGGLANYAIWLAERLKSTGGAVSYAAVDPVGGVDLRVRWPLLNRFCCALASRRIMHGALERLIQWAVQGKCFGSSELKAVHYVGTGWDFAGFAFAAAAHRQKIPFTIWPAVHPKSWGDDLIDIRLYNQANTVFCQSDFERSHLAWLGVEERRLVRCGLPPMCRRDGDAHRFKELWRIGQRPSVLFLGRRDAGKGYSALLAAWPRVLRAIPNAVLLLAGVARDEVSIEDIPTDSLRDLGVPNEEQKADALAACDVFCLPSTHESFGIVYVEAWSYGKPVICGTAPASRELVIHGQTGIHSSQDAEELTAALVDLLIDPMKAAALGRAGLEHQQRFYTDEVVLDAHLEAWRLR